MRAEDHAEDHVEDHAEDHAEDRAGDRAEDLGVAQVLVELPIDSIESEIPGSHCRAPAGNNDDEENYLLLLQQVDVGWPTLARKICLV